MHFQNTLDSHKFEVGGKMYSLEETLLTKDEAHENCLAVGQLFEPRSLEEHDAVVAEVGKILDSTRYLISGKSSKINCIE